MEDFNMSAADHGNYLDATACIDCDHERVVAFAQAHAGDVVTDRERAVRLYYAVRDGIRYDPYAIDLSVAGMRASTTLAVGRGWCVPKAVLLAACCRAMGIPARLGFADVRNHLATERLRKLMNTDVFFWHGYTLIHIQDRWLKATPAFNIELCQRFQLRPLDFDGTADSIFHPFDLAGRVFMEYIHYRGDFSDLPLDRISATLKRHYGPLLSLSSVDFYDDVNREHPAAPSGDDCGD
jgi:transglutaminase-like putative cysteine protease